MVSIAGRSAYSIRARSAACRADFTLVATTANIGCPAYCTMPSARIGSSCTTGPQSLTPGIPAAVSTAITPGAVRTPSRSSATMRACGLVLRPSAACSVPRGSTISSIYLASPATCRCALSCGSASPISATFDGDTERRSSQGESLTRVATPGCAFRCKTAATGLEREATISGGGSHVGERREVGVERGLASSDGRFRPGLSDERLFARRARFGTAAMPPQPTRKLVHGRHRGACKTDEDRGNILVEALRHLVCADVAARQGTRHADMRKEFAANQERFADNRRRTIRGAISRCASPRRRTTLAPRAISTGIESPIGEPFEMLPPSVAELRWDRREPRPRFGERGKSWLSIAKASVSVTAAPISRCDGVRVLARSSRTLPV